MPKPQLFKPPLEKEEQRAVTRLLTLAGFRVGATSQYRRSGQMVGLPDLVLLHRGLGRGGSWETKKYQRAGYHPLHRSTWIPEALSPAQVTFRADALVCNLLHGWGGLREAEDWLCALGLATRVGNGGIMITTPHRKTAS